LSVTPQPCLRLKGCMLTELPGIASAGSGDKHC
jgi:hypothetical protein